MKYTFVAVIILFLTSCGNNQPCKNTQTSDNQTENSITLAEFIQKTGNIINQKSCPYLVHAKDIYYEKNDFLVIDIRDSSEYVKGHIDGAYNVQRSNLMTFLQDSVNTAAYKKIAIVDDNGPLSEYVAMLLRFDGYNAYGLKFGIAAWNRKFKQNIANYLSNKYANKIDTIAYPMPQATDLPDVAKQNALDILDKRVAELIALPEEQIIVPTDEYFNNLDEYFTVAYWTESKYTKGHIIGSVRYNPRTSLGIDQFLKTLPTDKKILVFCNTGHHAIAVVAYLKLLGYDAYSIMYGVNSFMNRKFNEFAPGSAILTADVLCGDFPLLEGSDRTSSKTTVVTSGTQATPPPVVPVQRNTGGGNVGGCE